jgi:hypothetical protein
MAQVKISALTELLAASVDAGDFLPIVDTSAVQTKKVSVGSFDARYILEADINAKGDLLVGTADNVAGILTAGANDTMLMADSATGTGVKWAAPGTVRTALGLVIGTNVQAQSAVLDATTASFTTADETKLDGLSQYTDEQVRDVIGAALVAGTNVTITVDDVANTITIAASGGGGSGVSLGVDAALNTGISRVIGF